MGIYPTKEEFEGLPPELLAQLRGPPKPPKKRKPEEAPGYIGLGAYSWREMKAATRQGTHGQQLPEEK